MGIVEKIIIGSLVIGLIIAVGSDWNMKKQYNHSIGFLAWFLIVIFWLPFILKIIIRKK